MTRAAFVAMVSHWRRQPLQLVLLVLGLALATALATGVQAINAEAKASYARAAGALGGDGIDRLEAVTGGLRTEDFVRLRRQGWPVSPAIEGRLGRDGLRVLGLEPLTLPKGAGGAGLSEIEVADLGAFLEGTLGFAAPETLEDPGLAAMPGQLELRADPALPPGVVVVDIGVAARVLGMDRKISALLIDGAVALPDAAMTGLRRIGGERGGEALAGLTDSFHLNLTAFGFLAYGVGIFIVHAAAGLAFDQRRGMFRTLRAIGVPARGLGLLLLAETLGLALLSGLVGVGLGYLVAGLLLPDVAATLDGLYGASVPGTLTLRSGWVLAGLGMALGGALVATGSGLWQVWRLPPLESARPEAWTLGRLRADRMLALLGGLLLAGSAGLLAFGSGLHAGFLALGCLLMGAALCLPWALGLALDHLAGRARPGLAQWFWADTRQELPGLSLALMALMLALAANVGVGTMVSSFRLTFTGWLDQRLAAELYLTAESPEQAQALQDWLQGKVDAILPIAETETGLPGGPGEVYAIADHATYRDAWPLLVDLPGMWDLLHRGEGVMLNEQAWRRSGLQLGDLVPLPGGDLPLIGVYSDYGNPRSQVLLGLEIYGKRFPEAPALRFGLRLPPDRVAPLRTALAQEFGLPPEAMVDQAGLKALSLQIFERTFAVTAALNVLTLAVAMLAMVASLTTLSGLRLPGQAVIWALGLTQGHLARLELVRAVTLALLTAVLALPLGLGLAWVLLAVVNVEAFGWRLPMQVFPGEILRMGLMALATGLLAALWPALRLARRPPADLLRVFANAR